MLPITSHIGTSSTIVSSFKFHLFIYIYVYINIRKIWRRVKVLDLHWSFFFKMSIEAKDMLQFKLLKNEIISG